MFASRGYPIHKFGSTGRDNEQFNRPLGVTFDASNHLFVADSNNCRIQKFEIDGSYLLQFGKYGSSDGELSHPVGITAYDKMLVVDQCNCCISVFHSDGQFSHIIEFECPSDVAMTDNNWVLVADCWQHYISIFTVDGKYIRKVGTQGTIRGHLNGPSSITTDLYGFIIIAEEATNRISVFDRSGVFVHTLGLLALTMVIFYHLMA